MRLVQHLYGILIQQVNLLIKTGHGYSYWVILIFIQPSTHRLHSYGYSLLQRIAVHSGGDSGESNAVDVILLSQLQAVSVAACQQLRIAGSSCKIGRASSRERVLIQV